MRHKLHLKLLTARFTALMYWETSGVIRLLTAFQVAQAFLKETDKMVFE